MIRIQDIQFIALLVVATCMITLTSAQTSGTKALCERQRGCTVCISAHPNCVWCQDPNHPETIPRCQFQNETTPANCSKTGIINPKSDVYLLNDVNFTAGGSGIDFSKTVVQIKPQNITVKLRRGQTYKVNVTFRKIIDYPLDLYYVMDLSNSMKDDLEKLQSLGTRLISSIKQNVTKNFQVGFGSFVDKVEMPFTSTVEAQLQNPCAGGTDMSKCAPPFGFRHQLSITENETAFESAINKTEVSGNIDIPEGSFDALMQIAVCESHVKWRKGSTRVVLLTTDATPHIAMDGKLAAILEANDMKCHLKKGANSRLGDAIVYSKSKTMDYPSLGQLKQVLTSGKIRTIFAVTKAVLPIYQEIPKVLKELGEVAELASDSSNIIPLIQETYNKIKGRLVLHASNAPSHVTFTQRTYCPRAAPVDGSMDCNNITIGDEVVFELSFTANQCLKQKDQISLTSTSLTDVVTINLEYLCDKCNCTDIINSSICQYHGNMTCGLCTCEPGREGSKCQCNSAPAGQPALSTKCQMPDSTNGLCEGQGDCECGKCKCRGDRNSTYCQCKTTGCPISNTQLCGGKDKGWCNNCGGNGQCVCHPPYTIRATDKTCTCSNTLCQQSPPSSPVCSNHGSCACDTCICTNKWAGKFCQRCIHPTCTNVSMTCNEPRFRTCAECLSRSTECRTACPAHEYILYSRKDNFPNCGGCTDLSQTTDCKDCRKHDDGADRQSVTCNHQFASDSCTYRYQIFWTTDDRYIVYVKAYNRDLDCPQPINPLFIVLPTVGSILLIGLVLLIAWKVYSTLRDKRRWEEWEEEQKKRQWTKGENPIFETPENKFTNPMFDGNDE